MILLVALFPVQAAIESAMEDKAGIVRFTDELTTLLALAAIAVLAAVRPRRYALPALPATTPLLLFIAVCVLSAVVHTVAPLQALVGMYDYLKGFLALYAIAALPWTERHMRLFLRLIVIVFLVVAALAVIGEFQALLTGKSLWVDVEKTKRLGAYRVYSFLGRGNINYLGMYSLLIFTVVGGIEKGWVRQAVRVLALVVVYLTFSRQAWLGLAAIGVARRRGLLPLALIPVAGAAAITLAGQEHYDADVYYRTYAATQAFGLLQEHPLIGVGPGRFGSLASILFQPELYRNWPLFFRGMIERMGSIDSYWMSSVTETGVLGLSFYLGAFVALSTYLRRLAKRLGDTRLASMLQGLSAYGWAIVAMGAFSGLNKAFVLLTFMALCGGCISVAGQKIQAACKREGCRQVVMSGWPEPY